MSHAFNLTVGNDGVGRLVFDLPNEKINKLTLPILEELERTLDDAAKNPKIKALVIISVKEDVFIAGADLHVFQQVAAGSIDLQTIVQTGQRAFSKLQALPFPTIAYIHGACLGGGLEFALACTYRIASDSPKTILGLPEVSLGIIPGWGGTQRLPRLVGLMEAMGIILTGKPVKGQKAWKIHLVDALAANEFKEEAISTFLSKCLSAEGKKKILEKRKLHGVKHWLLEANPLGRAFLFHKATNQILKKTKGHYPAPFIAIDVLKESSSASLDKGLEIERKAVVEKIPKVSGISMSLINLFFIQEALKKDPGTSEDVNPIPIAAAGVLGAGVMGSGIAWLLTNRDYSVRLKDVDYTAVGKGIGSVKSLYDQYVKDRRLKKDEAALKFSHLSGTVELTGFQRADLVVEAAVENLELKIKLFKQLEAVISEKAIVCSNTSSLSITEMGKAFAHPDRFIGMHFFNPVHRMPLVEVVPGPQTSAQTIATVVDFCKKVGKTPIVVGDCRGFLVNRIFTASANELMRLFEEGVPHELLEQAMLKFGYPMGPFLLADEVGNDVMYKVNKSLQEAYGNRMQGPKIVELMNEHKLYGKKCGKGFYIYKGKQKKFNEQVKQWTASAQTKPTEKEIGERAILPMVNEAARCLQEKIILRPDYLDMALILGTGFPPFRGGLLKYADNFGIGNVVSELKALEQRFGERFTPCELLVEMGKSNKKFAQFNAS